MVMVLTSVVVVVVVVVAYLSRQNNSKRHQHPYCTYKFTMDSASKNITIVRSYFVCRGFDRLKGGT